MYVCIHMYLPISPCGPERPVAPLGSTEPESPSFAISRFIPGGPRGPGIPFLQ